MPMVYDTTRRVVVRLSYIADGGGDGSHEELVAEWLLPYWMAVYHKLIVDVEQLPRSPQAKQKSPGSGRNLV
jgi:hypothetical protein